MTRVAVVCESLLRDVRLSLECSCLNIWTCLFLRCRRGREKTMRTTFALLAMACLFGCVSEPKSENSPGSQPPGLNEIAAAPSVSLCALSAGKVLEGRLVRTQGIYHVFEKDYLTHPDCSGLVFVSLDGVDVRSPENFGKLQSASSTNLPMVQVVGRVDRESTATRLTIYVIERVASS
jgi:hypothetical protein